ncbi:MAG: hypothetical protein E4H36_04925 [Spirochaetales bacterium]|nr:MAG: hypothetical protein E4H36_04925 [Spirochaetales bacterium]
MGVKITLQKVLETLEAESLIPDAPLERTLEYACASDLMSDVLTFSRPKSILLTGLVTPQTVRTAEVADLLAVCFVFGKEPTGETIRLAKETGIPLFRTPYSLFTASGMLYALGITSCRDSK